MVRSLYQSVLNLASHPKAELALFLLAFAESSFFPIPPDALLIPMVIVNFNKAFRYAFICTAGSVLGGIFGYLLGYAFYDTVGQPIIALYEAQHLFAKFQGWYHEYDVYIVGVAGFSPIPYKVFTIASGMLHADLWNFILASVLSRGARFFLVAWLLWRGGPAFKGWIETNLYPLTMAAGIVFILGVVAIKILFQG